MKRLLFLFAVALVVSSSAQTNPSGATGTVTAVGPNYSDGVTYSIAPMSIENGIVTYQWSTSGYLDITGGPSYSGGWIVITAGSEFSKGSDTGSVAGTFTMTAGTTFHVSVRVYGHYDYTAIASTATSISPANQWNFYLTSAAPTTAYKITVNIPANNTQGLLRYHIKQGETLLQTVVTEPGQGPQIIQFTNLETDQAVTVQEVSYVTEYTEDPLNPGHYFASNSTLNEIRTVSTGTPSAGTPPEMTVEQPKPSAPAVIKTPETETPPAPVPVTPTVVHNTTVAVPTPTFNVPNATPSGTTATTKADTEKQTNDITAATAAAAVAANTSNNAVISAVDKLGETVATSGTKTVEGLNAVAKATGDGAAALVGASNKAQSSLDRINATLAAMGGGASAAGIASLNESISGGAAATAAGYSQSYDQKITPQDISLVTGFASKMPSVPNVFPSDVGTESHFRFDLRFPYIGDYPVDVDMAQYSTSITIIRGLMKACLAVLFFFLVVNTLRKATS